MPRRIPADTADAIKRDNDQYTQRELANKFGVARGTVAAILNQRHVATAEGNACPGRQVDFREAPRYWCGECERFVTVHPCPACSAREARRRGVRSAAHSITNDGPRRRGRRRKSDGLPSWSDTPLAVLDWIRTTLESAIDETAKPEDVDELIDVLSTKTSEAIEAIGRSIGEQRRQAHLVRFVV